MSNTLLGLEMELHNQCCPLLTVTVPSTEVNGGDEGGSYKEQQQPANSELL